MGSSCWDRLQMWDNDFLKLSYQKIGSFPYIQKWIQEELKSKNESNEILSIIKATAKIWKSKKQYGFLPGYNGCTNETYPRLGTGHKVYFWTKLTLFEQSELCLNKVEKCKKNIVFYFAWSKCTLISTLIGWIFNCILTCIYLLVTFFSPIFYE